MRRVLPVVLASAALIGLPATAWSQGQTASGSLPAEALALPADMGILMSIDAQAIFTSAEYKALLTGELLPGMSTPVPAEVRDAIPAGLKELEASTGVKLERDLDRLMVTAGDFGKEPRFAVLALGRLDSSRISSALEGGGQILDRTTVDGRSLLRLSKAGKAEIALAFLSERAVLFGTPGVVEAAVRDHAAGRRPFESNAELTSLVGRLDPAASLFIVIGRSATAAMRTGSGSTPPPFPIPDMLSMTAHFGGGFELVAEMPAEADARNMVDVVRGGLAAMRMRLAQGEPVPQAEGMKRMMDAVEVAAEGRRARLSVPGPSGGVMGVGVIAAIAIPSLLRARVAANEATAIGDIRTVIAAEAAYQSVAQGHGDLACLAKPASCLKGHSGPPLLDARLAGATEKSGYKRTFHPGPAGKKRGTYRGFAYTATPIQAGKTGARSFCGDATGRICFDPKGLAIVPSAGSCPKACDDLN